MILSINGLYGSGGKEVGDLLAKKLGYTTVDNDLIRTVEGDSNLDLEGAVKEFYQEEESKSNQFYKALFQLQTDVIPVGIKGKDYLSNKKTSGIFSGFMAAAPLASSGKSGAYAQFEIDILKSKLEDKVKKVAEQDNQIFYGHCSSYFLKDYPNVIKVFTKASLSSCRKHIQDAYGITADGEELDTLIKRTNMRRSYYFETFTGRDWENVQNYDLCIDTDILGIEGTAQLLADLVKAKQ